MLCGARIFHTLRYELANKRKKKKGKKEFFVSSSDKRSRFQTSGIMQTIEKEWYIIGNVRLNYEELRNAF